MNDITLSGFLAAFYPDEHEPIHLRAFKPRGAPDTLDNRARTLQTTRHALAHDAQTQATLRE